MDNQFFTVAAIKTSSDGQKLTENSLLSANFDRQYSVVQLEFKFHWLFSANNYAHIVLMDEFLYLGTCYKVWQFIRTEYFLFSGTFRNFTQVSHKCI